MNTVSDRLACRLSSGMGVTIMYHPISIIMNNFIEDYLACKTQALASAKKTADDANRYITVLGCEPNSMEIGKYIDFLQKEKETV